MRLTIVFAAAMCALSLASGRSLAAIIPPIGLAPGQQYQLIFVTYDSIAGTMGTEAPYNLFVNAEAAQNPDLPSTTWSSITTTVDGVTAESNAPWLGLPVYNTQGIQVNIEGQSLYSGTLANPVLYDQFGNAYPGPDTEYAYTGYGNDPVNSAPLGSPAGASDGIPSFTSTYWLDAGAITTPEIPLPIMALSGAITVAAPEPDGLLLAGLAVAGFFAWRRSLPCRPCG
ncbi:MAG TPA: PEP-CTERM sorting domain-containing protein [Pirellulales bacterium]|nr:PEP-CTERM sorting domain-containing protein [Pirellulales bacterium]